MITQANRLACIITGVNLHVHVYMYMYFISLYIHTYMYMYLSGVLGFGPGATTRVLPLLCPALPVTPPPAIAVPSLGSAGEREEVL